MAPDGKPPLRSHRELHYEVGSKGSVDDQLHPFIGVAAPVDADISSNTYKQNVRDHGPRRT